MHRWSHAIRPRTLPLAASSIIVGSSLAHFDGAFRWPVFLLALLTAILLQILSNLANDLGDHQHGADNDGRIGPRRAVQSGAIPAAAMKRAMILCGTSAFLCGLALIITATGSTLTTLVFLFLGAAAILAAVKYTYGRNPYGYAGLGDISVFLFFGAAGVMGTHFLHASRIDPLVLLPGAAFGSFSTGVLNTNNMRDIAGDAASGKRTLAVRLGAERSRHYHFGLLVLGGFLLVLFSMLRLESWWQFLFIVPYVLIALHMRRVMKVRDAAALDPELKRLALGTFFTALAFSLGLVLA